MKKIRLYWYNKANVIDGNFGDELGPYLIRKLSGCDIEEVIIPKHGILLVLTYLKNLLAGRYKLGQLPAVLAKLFYGGDYMISIGSIIGWGNGYRTVWGSGLLNRDDKVDNGRFLAVRGKYTQRRLRDLGYKAPDVLGDPALLLPIVYNPQVEKRYKLGIIPHHTQFKVLEQYGEMDDLLVINLLDDVEKIVRSILACGHIISTSLHGLIVSHAYGIPALWYSYPADDWSGDDIKYLDYFSSVGIDEYEPVLLPEMDAFDVDTAIGTVEAHREQALIQVDLKLLQRQLIEVAPFEVVSSCKAYCTAD